MSRPSPAVDLDHLRRLKVVDQLRTIVAGLDSGQAEQREELGWRLVELAKPTEMPSGKSPVAAMRRGVTKLRAGGDPSAIADAALFQVAKFWARWSIELRRAAIDIAAGRWMKFIEVLARDEVATVRANLSQLIVDTMDVNLAPALNALLLDRDRGVAQAAERAWIELGARLCGEPSANLGDVPRLKNVVPPEAAWTAAEMKNWRLALGAALRTFSEHRCRGVLLAALLLLDARSLANAERDAASDPLAALALSRDESVGGALRGYLRAAKMPIAAQRAFEWLAFQPLARAAADRLAEISTAAELKGVLSTWSLAQRPRRQSHIHELAIPFLCKGTLWSAGGKADAAGPIERAMAVHAFARVRGGPSERSRALEPALLDAHPLVRHAFARHAEYRDAVDLAFDADPFVSCTGAIRASLVGTGRRMESVQDESKRAHIWSSLTRSRDAVVRCIAAGELSRVSDWNSGRLGARESLRRALVADRDGTMRLLAEQLSCATPDGLIRLLPTVRTLNLVPELEALLLELASRQSSTAREALQSLATVVATLGEGRSSQSLDALQQFREHGDARVRANAVQAIGRRARVDAWSSRRLISSMIELKGDAQHRTRANALRSILDVSSSTSALGVSTLPHPASNAAHEAVESLAAMLTDDRIPHRLAGVWLASRSMSRSSLPELANRTPELSARVLELSRFDADPSVRHRAKAAAELVERQTRLVWKSEAEGRPARWAWAAA